MKLEVVREMMTQRGFKEYKVRKNFMIGIRTNNFDENEYIYIKIFNDKFELNVVREFLWSKFIVDSYGNISTKVSGKNVVQLVIICKSFQNSHIKEFNEVSKNIQLIRCDFFNINITKKVPLHIKVNDVIKNKREIPIIKEDDPNCIFYNFVKGDVIKIIRSDGDICYRLVR
jgi:DNA-directed RNA polymerase subunit H (RpoH/RPB5)